MYYVILEIVVIGAKVSMKVYGRNDSLFVFLYIAFNCSLLNKNIDFLCWHAMNINHFGRTLIELPFSKTSVVLGS